VLPDDIKHKILFEIDEINTELASYKPLFDIIRQRTPDLIEMTALASVLHSFYNGLENIFILVAKKVDFNLPSGPKWHNELLIQMSRGNTSRKEVINEKTFEVLKEYLQFRHYIRHSYKWRLNWDEFKGIAINLEENWKMIKELLVQFVSGE